MMKLPASPSIANTPFDTPFDVEDAYMPVGYTPVGVPQAVPQTTRVNVPQVTFEQAVASVLARIRSRDLRNPSSSFSDHAKDGDYNGMTDAEYRELLAQTELIATAWRRREHLEDPAALVGRVALGGLGAWIAWLRTEPLTHEVSSDAIGSLEPVPLSREMRVRVARIRDVAAGLEATLAARLDEAVVNPALGLARRDRRGEETFDQLDRSLAVVSLDQLSRNLWHELPSERADVIAGRVLLCPDCGEVALGDLRFVHRLIENNDIEGEDPS